MPPDVANSRAVNDSKRATTRTQGPDARWPEFGQTYSADADFTTELGFRRHQRSRPHVPGDTGEHRSARRTAILRLTLAGEHCVGLLGGPRTRSDRGRTAISVWRRQPIAVAFAPCTERGR